MMDDLDGIPRGGHEPDSLKALWKVIKKIVADISVLQRAAPQRSMSLTDGGDLTIKNGGKVTIEDQGEVVVVGQGEELISQDPVEVRASLANRLHFNSWIEQTILQAGLFLGLSTSRGDRDPRVVSDDGLQIEMASAVEPLLYGPQVGPTMVTDAGVTVGPGRASIGTGTWDDALNPGGGGGLAGHKGYATLSLRPHDIMLWLGNQTGGTAEIPDGLAIGITATLEEGVLQLYGRNGVNITGAGLTVDGLPVGGAVTSVAGKTGDVDLVKADVGLSNVDNTSDASKPVSTATQAALNGKASTAVATSTTDGLMPLTDKAKLDGSTPSATPFRVMQRDSLGRAKVTDPAVAADVSTKGYVDSAVAAVPTPLPLARGKIAIAGPVAAGGVSGSVAVTFPAGLFIGEPVMTFGTNDPRVSPNITGLSAAGCNIRAFNYTTAATTASPAIWWIAIQS